MTVFLTPVEKGVDKVDYSGRTANLVITLNGLAGDGEAGENDNIHTDVEHVIGGSGNDDITGSASNNSLVGNDGNDTLRGLTGDDTLQGNAGEDVLQGGQGADIVDGGTGIDWSLYDDNPEALNIVLNGLADDGSAGEGDNTATENIRGGIGNDTIIGSSANNLIEGLDGNDIIKGMGGNDTLVGGAGDDTLDGGWGSDVLQGDAGTDTATYSGRTGSLVTTLDGIANDTQINGMGVDTYNVWVDVENVIGSLDADLEHFP